LTNFFCLGVTRGLAFFARQTAGDEGYLSRAFSIPPDVIPFQHLLQLSDVLGRLLGYTFPSLPTDLCSASLRRIDRAPAPSTAGPPS